MYTKAKESAVSEVIGIVLIVALTIIMAAIMASQAYGLIDRIPSTRTVVVTADLLPDGSQVYITYRGGPDHTILNYLTIRWPDGTLESWPNPQFGEIYQSTGSMNLTSGKDHVVVTGHFKDNKEVVVLDTMF